MKFTPFMSTMILLSAMFMLAVGYSCDNSPRPTKEKENISSDNTPSVHIEEANSVEYEEYMFCKGLTSTWVRIIRDKKTGNTCYIFTNGGGGIMCDFNLFMKESKNE